MSGIYNVYAVESVKAVWYPLLVDGQMLFIILTLVVSLSVLMLIVFLFMMIGGVDTRPGDPRTPEATLKDADARMYIEKMRMKNGTAAR